MKYQISSVVFAFFFSERHLSASQKSNEPAREVSDRIGSVGDTDIEGGWVVAQGRALVSSLLEQFAVHRIEEALQQLVNLKTKLNWKIFSKNRLHISHECRINFIRAGGLVGDHLVNWPGQGGAQVGNVRLDGGVGRSGTIHVVEVDQTGVVKYAMEKPGQSREFVSGSSTATRITYWLEKDWS